MGDGRSRCVHRLVANQKHMLESQDKISNDQQHAKSQLTDVRDTLSKKLDVFLKKTSKELDDVISKQQEIIERFEEDRQAAEQQAAAGVRRGGRFFGAS